MKIKVSCDRFRLCPTCQARLEGFKAGQKQTNEEVLKLIDNELKEVVKSLSNSYGKIRTKRFLESPKKYSMINNVGVYWRLLELKSKLSGGKE
jgi:hypothetical protein